MTSLKAATDGVKTIAKPKISELKTDLYHPVAPAKRNDLDQGIVQPIGASQTSEARTSTHGTLGRSVNNLLAQGDVNLSVRPRPRKNSAGPVRGILDIGHSITVPHEDTHPSREDLPPQIRKSRYKIGPLLDLPFEPRPAGTKRKKVKAKPKPPNPKAYLELSNTRYRSFFWDFLVPWVDTPPVSPEMSPTPVASTSTSSTASGRQPLSRTVSYMSLGPTSGISTPRIDTPPASPEMSPTPVASTSTSSTASRRRPLSRTESYLFLGSTSVNSTRVDTPPASPERSPAPVSSTSTSPAASKRPPLSRTVSYISLQPFIHQTPALSIPSLRVDTPPVSPEMVPTSVPSTSINPATPTRKKLERTVSYLSLEPMVGGSDAGTAVDNKASANTSTAKANLRKRAREDEWDLETEAERPSQRARTEAAGDDEMEGSSVTNLVSVDQASMPDSGSLQTVDAGSKPKVKVRFVQAMSFQIALEKFKESRGYGAEASH